MSFSRYFKLVAIATALMIGYSPAAKKISSGKIRNASGPQALHEPKGKGGYIPAETGSKVTKKDRFKTGDESLIIIGPLPSTSVPKPKWRNCSTKTASTTTRSTS